MSYRAAWAASLNSDLDHAVAQAQHGSDPDIAGKDIANPVALIKSAAMLLHCMAFRQSCPEAGRTGDLIDQAVGAVLAYPASRTPDLGGPLDTTAFSERVCREITARDQA